MAGGPGQTDDQPAVLEAPVGIEQARTGGRDVGPERLAAQRRQPTLPVRLDVVVQEDQHVPPGDSSAGVVELRPVERASITEDPDARSGAEELDERRGLGIGRTVVDQHELRRLAARGRGDGVDTGPQEARLVPEGDQDADRRAARDRPSHAEGARRSRDHDRRLVPAADGFLEVGLARARRTRTFRPPMTEHLGDVDDGVGQLAGPQRELVFGRRGVGSGERRDSSRHIRADHDRSPQVARAELEVGGVLRLEAGRRETAGRGALVLVRVDDRIRLRGATQRRHGVGDPPVARVDQGDGDLVAPGERLPQLRAPRAAVGHAEGPEAAPDRPAPCPDELLDLGESRLGCHDAQRPGLARLVPQAVERDAQRRRGCIAREQDQAEGRAAPPRSTRRPPEAPFLAPEDPRRVGAGVLRDVRREGWRLPRCEEDPRHAGNLVDILAGFGLLAQVNVDLTRCARGDLRPPAHGTGAVQSVP